MLACCCAVAPPHPLKSLGVRRRGGAVGRRGGGRIFGDGGGRLLGDDGRGLLLGGGGRGDVGRWLPLGDALRRVDGDLGAVWHGRDVEALERLLPAVGAPRLEDRDGLENLGLREKTGSGGAE